MIEIPQWFLHCNPEKMRNMVEESTYKNLFASFIWETTKPGHSYWRDQSRHYVIEEDGKEKLAEMVGLLDHFDFNVNTFNVPKVIDVDVDVPFMVGDDDVVAYDMFVKIDTIALSFGNQVAVNKAIAVLSELSDRPKRRIGTIDYQSDMTVMVTETDILVNGHQESSR
ncbi:MAG: hypothetical protein WC284_14760 [Candidimonas sp.]